MRRQRNGRKLLPRILIGLNLFCILLLLCASGLLLAFSLSDGTLLGYGALLEAPSREGGDAESDRLLLYRAAETADSLPPDGRVLLQAETGELIWGQLLRSDEGSLVCRTDAGREVDLAAEAVTLRGELLLESGAWGHTLAVIAAPGTLPVTYTVIGIAFLFCIVILLLLCILSARKRRPDPVPIPERTPKSAEDVPEATASEAVPSEAVLSETVPEEEEEEAETPPAPAPRPQLTVDDILRELQKQ